MSVSVDARSSSRGARRSWVTFDLRFLGVACSIGLLVLMVIVPIGVMAIASLRPPQTLPFEGSLILSNYTDVFGHPSTPALFRNTIVFAIGSLLLAMPIAFSLAFLTERTDLPGRNAFYSLMFIPMSVPVFATALGWVLLLGPRAGTINEWLRIILNLNTQEGPINVFSLGGMIFVQAIGMVPSMWLILISVLRRMDPSLEEAAAAAGAGRMRTLTHVTAPLMAPGLLAIAVLYLVVGMETLETPLALGRTAGIDVLATRVYEMLHTTQGFAYGPPATLGMSGLILGLIGISGYLYFLRRANKYAVVTGKGYRPRMITLGAWRWPAVCGVGLYMALAAVIPFAVLVVTSFQQFYQPLVPDVRIIWTLNNYQELLDYRFFGQYFVNTIVVSAIAATVTMLFVTFIAWQLVRWPSRLTQLVNALAFLPLSVPAVISGLAFFLLFIGTPLYGTIALLVLAYTARFIAYGTRLMHAAQVQIHRELEEAALTAGVGQLVTFLQINLRLLLPAFMNGWLWVLTHAARDFTTALVVAGGGVLLASNVIFDRFANGRFPLSAAMMVALVMFNLTAVFIGRKWIGRTIGQD
ncbi:MAG: ABC transporter permease [Chloroflexota bacterium]